MVTVPDSERYTLYTPVTPTTTFLVGFPLFNDGRYETAAEYVADLKVYLDGVLQTDGFDLSATFDAESGADETASIEVDAPGWTGRVEILDARPPRRTAQFIEGKGVPAIAHNLALNIIQAHLRTLYDRLERGPDYGADGSVINFNGSRQTGLGAGTAASDALTKGQIEGLTATIAAGGLAYAALLTSYANDVSGLDAETVQAAIDEVVARLVDAEELAAALAAISVNITAVAQNRFLGRVSSGTGAVEQLTATQMTAALNAFTSSLKGLVPAPTSTEISEKRVVGAEGTGWVIPRQLHVHAVDLKTAGTAGGTFSSAAWRTRTLNTAVTNPLAATLSSNRLTLPAGTYWVDGSAPGYKVAQHQARLQNVTAGVTLLFGTSQSSSANESAVTRSHFSGQIIVAAAQQLEVQHYGSTTRSNDGFGVAVSSGISEIYSEIKAWRIA